MENNIYVDQKFSEDRRKLILKLEESGFVYINGLFCKKLNNITSSTKYLCFVLNDYYGHTDSVNPRFGISDLPSIGLYFTLRNSYIYFDTYPNAKSYPEIICVFDSILNFFEDGRNVSSVYKISSLNRVENTHLTFSSATYDPDTLMVTFSSSGKYFVGNDIKPEKTSDLYGY